jgi:hypothetical protein
VCYLLDSFFWIFFLFKVFFLRQGVTAKKFSKDFDVKIEEKEKR